MRTKDNILDDIRVNINLAPRHTRPPLELQYILIEVLLDIRNTLVTDAKDAMNALIQIRRNKHDEA